MLQRGKFCIKGTWDDTPTPAGRLTILLNPAPGVFGIGTHISTRLFLEALELNAAGGSTVVDFGAGTGILSIAAARMGAAKVYAAEVRDDALLAMRANLLSNGLSDVVQLDREIPSDVETEVDLAVCNVDKLEDIIQVIAKAEVWLRPGGLLAILPANIDVPVVDVVLEDHPYKVVDRREVGDLSLMTLGRL